MRPEKKVGLTVAELANKLVMMQASGHGDLPVLIHHPDSREVFHIKRGDIGMDNLMRKILVLVPNKEASLPHTLDAPVVKDIELKH